MEKVGLLTGCGRNTYFSSVFTKEAMVDTEFREGYVDNLDHVSVKDVEMLDVRMDKD